MTGSHEVAGSSPAGSTSKGPHFAGLFSKMNGTPQEIRARIDGSLDGRARKHVGIVVGVRRGGETTIVGRGRVADDRTRAPDERTIFEIGSITKVFTATLLADMAREGLVALDDPVQRHLPDGVVIPVRGRPITLADLATHTSGFPRLPEGLLRRALRDGANPYASFTVDDLQAAIPVTKPRREPGRKIKYSNYGVGLLGHVLALRAGTTYEELVAGRITGPLRMTDTSIAVPDDKLDRFAEGHSRRGKPVSNWDLPALAGAGALRSTVSDLADVPRRAARQRAARACGGDAPDPRAAREPPRALGWARLDDPARRRTARSRGLARRRHRRLSECRRLRRGVRNFCRRAFELVPSGRPDRSRDSEVDRCVTVSIAPGVVRRIE